MGDNFKREVSMRGVWLAKSRLKGLIRQTPLIYSQPLSERTGSAIYLKLENEHATGSFKIRGAVNKVLSLSETQRSKGIATFSTGNHGIAVAYVSKKLGIPATVCVSKRVPNGKINRLRQMGANVLITGESQDDAEAYCEKLESENGMTIIKPFDDPLVIEGQATIGMELLEDCPMMEQVIVPLSGGGLLSGIGFFLKNIDQSINVTGVTMKESAVMHKSLATGHPIAIKEKDTLADSLLGGIGMDNKYTFHMTQKHMNKSYLVSEKAIADGILFLLKHHKILVEGAAAIGVGWILQQKKLSKGPTVIIISGNNIDYSTLRKVMEGH